MAVVSTSRTKQRTPRDASPNVGRVPKAAETTPPEPPATQRATRKKMTKRSGGAKQTKAGPTNRRRADGSKPRAPVTPPILSRFRVINSRIEHPKRLLAGNVVTRGDSDIRQQCARSQTAQR